MYSNGVNSYTPIKEEHFKPKMDSQFNFDGEAFSDLMEKEEPSGNGLRETAQELAEDEAVARLSDGDNTTSRMWWDCRTNIED